MKQIEVQIMGQSYLLGCPDGGEAQLRDAVDRVDAAMCKIRDAGKVKARDRIAVLASLNLAFDLAAQQTAAAAASAPAAAAPAGETGEAGEADAKAAQLIQKLDQALAGDDHLL
jgi:cell division protein ZapA